MSYGLIDYNTLHNIGEAIRYKTNVDVNYYPREMPTAINAIQTSGGGFAEPVGYSTKKYYTNSYDNKIIERYNFIGFETTNELPENAEIIDEHAEWPGMSPGQMVFYKRWQNNIVCERHLYNSDNGQYYYGNVSNVNGWFYGVCVNNTYTARQGSFIDISNLANGCYNFSFAHCGPYTTSMVEAYSYCGNLVTAVCGPNVIDMTNAYACDGNLRDAACGNLVQKMCNAYYCCYNLESAVIGSNVTNMANAYERCSKITGTISLTENLKDISGAFINCLGVTEFNGYFNSIVNAERTFENCYSAYFNNVELNSLETGNFMFHNCPHLLNVGYLKRAKYASHMFANCYSLENFSNMEYENLRNAQNMFKSTGISQQEHDKFMRTVGLNVENFSNNYDVNMSGVFTNCRYIHTMYISNRFNYGNYNFDDIYQNCNITNVVYEDNVKTIARVFKGFGITNIEDEIGYPDSIENAYMAFYNCKLITDAYVGPNVSNMHQMFENCSNLLNGYFVNMATDIGQCYRFCNNLNSDIVITENVVRAEHAFYGCNNLQNIAVLPIWNSSVFANYYYTENAFYRNNYSFRRNVACVNRETFNCLLNSTYRFFGSGIYFTEQTHQTPVEVNINGVTYNAVRSAYNTYINTYIYCEE